MAQSLKAHAIVLGATTATLWAVLAANIVVGGSLFAYGVQPRTLEGLRGIVLAPFGAGLVAWALGAPGSVHIGASGIVFGYFGFLVFAGWFARSFGSIILSVAVTTLWGTAVLGVLPGQPGISWQSHLGGFIGGALAAKWLAPRR